MASDTSSSIAASRASFERKLDLRAKSWAATMDSLSIVTRATQATEFEPYYKQLFSSSCRNHSQPWVPDVWKEIKEVDVGIDNCESDMTVALSQEQELCLELSGIDINRKIDVSMAEKNTECDDEIEEW